MIITQIAFAQIKNKTRKHFVWMTVPSGRDYIWRKGWLKKKAAIDKFLLKYKNIFQQINHGHAVNAEESFWRCEKYHLKTWALVNSQKAGFTAVATISLSGKITFLFSLEIEHQQKWKTTNSAQVKA